MGVEETGGRAMEEIREAADRMRERLFGAVPARPADGARRPLDDIHDLLFGAVWSDETLPLRERSLLTIAALITQGREQQLRTHVRVALRLGISAQQIEAAITHLALYAGVPAANAALSVAREVAADSPAPKG